MRSKITAVVAAAALAITSFSTVMPTPAMADGNAIISQYGLPATTAEMDDARGGWVWVVALVGAKVAIKACKSKALSTQCAAAAGGVAIRTYGTIAGARAFACNRWGRFC